MSSIIVKDQRYPLTPGATVLDTLLDAGLEVPFSCRAGACQSCMLRASHGTIPVAAQQGLKDTLKAEGWFLACRCKPTSELSIDLDASATPTLSARVVAKQQLSPHVMGLWLQSGEPLKYFAGQYLTLWRDAATGRSYSLASLPEERQLELHIARVNGGALSSWLHDTLEIGDSLNIQGPMGDCFYLPGDPEQPLLLVGTGTGLAPLYGIMRDALQQGHSGPIHLFHGARTADYLYYHDKLTTLSAQVNNLYYYPSLVDAGDGMPAEGVEIGAVDQLLKQHLPVLEGWRVFLSGAPDIVKQLRKQCFLAGASSNAIHTDPFG